MLSAIKTRTAVLLTLIMMMSGLAACAQQRDIDVSIVVNASRVTGRWNNNVNGNNVNWINNCDGLFDGKNFGFTRVADSLVHDLGVRLLRFPGGGLAETYNWSLGIGAQAARGESPNYDGIPQRMICGLDDFLAFCEKHGITPVLTVRYRGYDLESIAGLVEYCNGSENTRYGKMRASNGHPRPYGVHFWEVGNEVYSAGLKEEVGRAYGQAVARISRRMKEVDGSIAVGAIGLGVLPFWDNAVLSECAATVDYVIYHRYFPNTSSQDSFATNDAIVAATRKLIREVDSLKAHAKRWNPALEVAVTEYNLDFRTLQGKLINKNSDMQQALFIAECQRLFQEHGVLFATKWDLASQGRHFFADIDFNNGGELSISPSYYAEKLMGRVQGGSLLETTVSSPAVNVLSFGEIHAIMGAPLVTASAVRSDDGRKITLIVVNRQYQGEAAVHVNLQGFSDPVSATQWQIAGSPDAHNVTVTKPVAVSSLESMTVPGSSLTVIEISQKP